MTVGIVGLGLIGGSIGLALREPGRRIVGCDDNPEAESVALSRFCVDAVAPFGEVAQAEVVFVAVPPKSVVVTLDRLASERGPETVVTDCTSAKAEVVEWALRTSDKSFVAGHPMAGHQQSGATFASSWMFRGAKWILCPLKHTAGRAVKSVEMLVKAMGAIPVRMEPELHDRQIAVLSHLPHALAGTLVLMREKLGDGDVSGGSWRDLTRVGGVDPALWTQIFMSNRVELATAIGDFSDSLLQVRAALEAGNEAEIRAFFMGASAAKKKEPSP